MNILVTLDSNYVYPLCVMLSSMVKSNPTSRFDVYVVYSSLTENDFAQMTKVLGSADAELHRVLIDGKIFDSAPVMDRISRETYYRLLIGDILPDDVHKILYIDPDVVIRKSIEGFYNTDLSNHVLAGGIHTYGVFQTANRRRVGLKKTSHYINAGIMLINLDKWRQTVTLDQIFAYISQNIKKLILADQDVVNALFGDSVLLFDERIYNLDEKTMLVFSSRFAGKNRIDLAWVRENTAIVHYNGKHKPWLEEKYSGKLGEFFEDYRNF